MAANPTPSIEYTKEVRFAVVMYGGVSLAIYINGVAQELLRMVKSTAATAQGQSVPRELPMTASGKPCGTEAVYRKLSCLVDDRGSRKKLREDLATNKDAVANWQPQDNIRVRFMVDVLAGTSAGGINSIYLAKALANDQNIDELKNLWITEGDIDVLINDRKSLQDTTLGREKAPHSLLNSRRMYLRLLEALDGMDAESEEKRRTQAGTYATGGSAPNVEANGNKKHSPLVDELDLYITATDIRGLTLPIRLSDAVVHERRHKNVFHFKYMTPAATGADVNEFRQELNPFLAFAARTTSSFPFAFEPVRLTDIRGLLAHSEVHRANKDKFKPNEPMIKRFFKENLTQESESSVADCDLRSFADGGYLDNKPFSYATSALMRRTPNVPVDRKLIYIEPSPEHPEREVQPNEPPDAIQNVLAALNLPRYETIREDIQTVLDRNRLIERVNSLTSEIERDIENCIHAGLSTPAQAALNTLSQKEQEEFQKLLRPNVQPAIPWQLWNALTLPDMAALLGIHYLPYRRLRISALTDEIAKLTTTVAGFNERSDMFTAIRALVRTWRKATYSDEGPRQIDARENGDPNVAEAKLGTTVSRPQDASEQKQPRTLNYFLNKFDLDYRMRRLNFLVGKIDELFSVLQYQARMPEKENIGESLSLQRLIQKIERHRPKETNFDFWDWAGEHHDQAIQVLLYLKCELNQEFIKLRKFGREVRNAPQDAPATISKPEPEQITKIRKFRALVTALAIKEEDLRSMLGETSDGKRLVVNDQFGVGYLRQDDIGGRAQSFWDQNADLQKAFHDVAEHLQELINSVLAPTGARVRWLLNLEKKTNGSERDSNNASVCDPLDPQHLESEFALTVRAYLAWYFEHFDDYDQISFPVYFETEAGESDIIEVIRISPEDAPSLINEKTDSRRRKKLAGTKLANFSAFLDAAWRVNDIMWGRLDGAERLIKSMLPDDDDKAVRDALTREAHQIILAEELAPNARADLAGLLGQALLERKAREKLPVSDAIDKILKPIDNEVVKRRLTNVMTTCFEGDELYAFMRDHYEVNRRFEPEPTLKVLGRATRVIGKILDDISKNRNVENKFTQWLSRVGNIFLGLVEVAVPDSLWSMLLRHWLKLLYLLEVVLVIGGTFLSQTGVKSVGWSLLAVTFGINVAVLVLRDVMRAKKRWLWFALSLLVAVVGFFAAVGVDELLNIGARSKIAREAHRVTGGAFGTPAEAPTPIPVLVTFPPTPSPSPSPTASPGPN